MCSLRQPFVNRAIHYRVNDFPISSQPLCLLTVSIFCQPTAALFKHTDTHGKVESGDVNGRPSNSGIYR